MRGEWRSRAGVDVRLCAMLIAGSGLVFLVENLVRIGTAGIGNLTVPIIAAVLDVASAAAVVLGVRLARPGVLVVVLLGALLHMLITLGGGLLWVRIVSGLLFAALMYSVVVLNTKPVREHFGLSS